jgi:HemY protein
MRRLLWWLIFLIVTVWLGVQIKRDPGYALFAYGHWSLEMPLWFMIFALIVILTLLHHLFRFIQGASNLNKRWQNWLSARRLQATRRKMVRGFIDLTEGRWEEAEGLLTSVAKRSDAPVLNYLAAARAAHEQGAYVRRDDYLRAAHESAGEKGEMAVSLTQAQLQLGHKQFEQALATLTHLRSMMPHHPYVLRLLKILYVELQEWQHLIDLLPDLRRYKVFKPMELDELETDIFSKQLQALSQEANPRKAGVFWQSLPRHAQQSVELIKIYVSFLLSHGDAVEAERLITHTLKKQWDDDLVYCYGLVHSVDPERQLVLAETWLKLHPHNAALCLTLGRLAALNRLWGKARQYLEASLHEEPKAETYRELGELLERLNEQSAAFACYKKGLQLS